MILEQRKYTYNDLSIVPTKESNISSRSQCNPFVGGTNMLPLFTAPMDSVVGMENYNKWDENGINAIIPRTIGLKDRMNLAKEGYWIAVSLNEFKANFVDITVDEPCRVLIDVANGHMKIIYDLVKEAKRKNKNLAIMVGNIANPETYKVAQDAGVDYIRCGIGAGKGCFAAGTLITTADGTKKPIEEIKPGDIVITHLKKEKQVTELKKVESDELIYINGKIKCTPNHKFLVINLSDIDLITEDNLIEYAYWICADQLDKNKHILVELNNEIDM